MGSDSDAASAARSDLIAAGTMHAIPGSKDEANPAFLGYYLTSLGNEFRSALNLKPSIRVKVNVAIVVAKVAESVKAFVPPGLQMRNLILPLMQDKCEAVSLWGTKAAASALTAKDRTVPNTPLVDELIPTVVNHKLNGAITDEAYGALQDMDQPKVIPTLLQLYELRVAAYRNGVPPEPAVDARASTTLTVQAGMWAKLSAKDRTKVMLLIADQLTGAAKAIGDSTDTELVDQLRQTMIRTSQAVVVVSARTEQRPRRPEPRGHRHPRRQDGRDDAPGDRGRDRDPDHRSGPQGIPAWLRRPIIALGTACQGIEGVHSIPSDVVKNPPGAMRRLLVIPIALLLLLAGAMALSRSAADQKADFTFVPRGDVKTLDLSKMSYLQDIRLAYALWEGLYTLDPVSFDPIPGCAFPIEVSADKKTYEFHLRPDAQWTNGDPLLAKDFLFGWKRIMDDQGEYAYLLNYIEGAEEYQKAIEARQKDPSVKADFSLFRVDTKPDDPRFLRVHLKDPTTFFPDLCAFPCFFPSHEASMVEKDARGNTKLDEEGKPVISKTFTRPPNLVTNGPYRLDDWEFKRKLRLVASDHYWNRKAVKSRVVESRVIDDQQNALSAYESGQVDWIAEVQGDFASELRKLGRTDLKAFPSFGTYFYSFNCREHLPDGSLNPLRKVEVRRALVDGDRQAVHRGPHHPHEGTDRGDLRAGGGVPRI